VPQLRAECRVASLGGLGVGVHTSRSSGGGPTAAGGVPPTGGVSTECRAWRGRRGGVPTKRVSEGRVLASAGGVPTTGGVPRCRVGRLEGRRGTTTNFYFESHNETVFPTLVLKGPAKLEPVVRAQRDARDLETKAAGLPTKRGLRAEALTVLRGSASAANLVGSLLPVPWLEGPCSTRASSVPSLAEPSGRVRAPGGVSSSLLTCVCGLKDHTNPTYTRV
jgi:hypothetical protein